MGKLRDSARKLKIWIIAILLIVLIVFVLSNLRPGPIYFLRWHRDVPISLALILAAAMGFVAGLLWGARKALPKN